MEAEAVLLILERCEVGDWTQISSGAAALEIDAIKDRKRRARVRQLLPPRLDRVTLDTGTFRRADELQSLGIRPVDALHLAAAEMSADVFLTCDDRLLNASRRSPGLIRIRVHNPVDWLKEIDDAPHS
jgi:predicted nucleic acid-binding protein